MFALDSVDGTGFARGTGLAGGIDCIRGYASTECISFKLGYSIKRGLWLPQGGWLRSLRPRTPWVAPSRDHQ